MRGGRACALGRGSWLFIYDAAWVGVGAGLLDADAGGSSAWLAPSTAISAHLHMHDSR